LVNVSTQFFEGEVPVSPSYVEPIVSRNWQGPPASSSQPNPPGWSHPDGGPMVHVRAAPPCTPSATSFAAGGLGGQGGAVTMLGLARSHSHAEIVSARPERGGPYATRAQAATVAPVPLPANVCAKAKGRM
jgi:hypothetical protein